MGTKKQRGNGGNMKTTVRMDDITPNMDWEKFLEFKALLDEHGIRPLIGVVPDNRDENLNRGAETGKAPGREKIGDFWEYIRALQNEGWIVAMHGYRHVYTSKKGGMFPLNHFSEFAGLAYERQLAMLEKGRSILESHGIKTDIFMAPAHSYDQNTLKALQKTGFTKMTDGFGSQPYVWKGMCFYPISFRLENSLKKKNGMTTMVVHTNTMERKGMERCGAIFEGNEMMSYGDYLKEGAAKRGLLGRWTEYLLATVKHILVKLL